MDDFDDIWQHEKHKMIMKKEFFITEVDYYEYEIKKNIAVRNIKLKIKYNENYDDQCDKRIMFDNLIIEICGKHHMLEITLRFNNFIASLLGIKNSICLIPIIQENLNSFVFLENSILIRLRCENEKTYIKYVDEVYVEYEKLENVSDKKIKSLFLINFCHFSRFPFLTKQIYYYDMCKISLNFIILRTSFGFKNHKGKKKLEFDEMILNISYHKNEKITKYKKIKINYDDLVVKYFLGDVFYVIFLDEKMTNIKNIAYNYHKKNEDKKIMYYIEKVQFVPDIKIYGSIYFYVF